MRSKTETPLELFLNEHDDEAWREAVAELTHATHEVDRTATRIWFHFFPVALLRAFEQAEDPAKLAQELLMQGKWFLKDQVDSSHTFLYGHRFWPEVKRAVARAAEAKETITERSLAGVVREVAREVASGAATDKRPWHELDTRCTVNEGPIPVQCRSASCGTCWVGVLGGAEKLSETDWRERKMMPLFGYIETSEARPLIRLSCQAKAAGAVSVVIPPWNGYFGKYLKRQKEDSAEATSEAVVG